MRLLIACVHRKQPTEQTMNYIKGATVGIIISIVISIAMVAEHEYRNHKLDIELANLIK